MLPAVRFYTYSKRFEEAYTAAMRPLTEELDMAQPAVDILLFWPTIPAWIPPGPSAPTAI